MREYERTHPWISFGLDLRAAPVELWMLLGEARSKCEHIAAVPLLPAVAERLHRLYLAKGVAATTAIEGNTLSEEQVVEHLEGRLQLPPSKQYLAQEVDDIAAACDRIAHELSADPLPPLTADLIKTFNRIVLDKLTLEPGVVAGEVRRYSVGAGGYRAAPWEDCEFLLERLCEWLEGPDFELRSADLLPVYAIVKAVLTHLYIAWIRPFGDGNGRTARLVEFRILAAAGFSTPAAHLLSNHYNQTRPDYYTRLREASQSAGGVVSFLMYAVNGFVEELKAQLAIVRDQQWTVAWRDYVYGRFRDKVSPASIRQRILVLALTAAGRPVPSDQVRFLTPQLAELYAQKTPKTLARDLAAVVEMGLVEKGEGGYRARMETILAFLPLRNAYYFSQDRGQWRPLDDLRGGVPFLPT
jgi:Fic family protein